MNATAGSEVAALVVDPGTVYLIVGAALIFGACVYAAKRILRQLTPKQVGIISLITVLTIGMIWGVLALGTRKRETPQLTPDITQPTPLLQPTPD